MACDNFVWFPDKAVGANLSEAATQPAGESQDKFFSSKKAFECKSINFSINHSHAMGSASPGASVGKAKFDEFTVEKPVDLASVPLYQAMCAGAHFPTLMLAIRKQGGNPLLYVQYMFRMVFVTSISWTGGQGEELPTETVKFKYGAIGLQYQKQAPNGQADPKGPQAVMWSASTNKPNMDVPGLPGAAPKFLNP